MLRGTCTSTATQRAERHVTIPPNALPRCCCCDAASRDRPPTLPLRSSRPSVSGCVRAFEPSPLYRQALLHWPVCSMVTHVHGVPAPELAHGQELVLSSGEDKVLTPHRSHNGRTPTPFSALFSLMALHCECGR
jgi:hypothetical protein